MTPDLQAGLRRAGNFQVMNGMMVKKNIIMIKFHGKKKWEIKTRPDFVVFWEQKEKGRCFFA